MSPPSAQHLRTWLALGTIGCLLVSCSTWQKEKSEAEVRKDGYEALLKTVKPGMYRRQLYAVLPPCEKPKAQPPRVCGVAGVLMYWAHQERHQLDADCYLDVHYQLKNGSEYRKPKAAPTPRTTKASTRKTIPITPDTIDALLTAEARELTDFMEDEVPSKENPDDIIISVTGVHLVSQTPKQLYLGITVSPTQEQGFIFGREPKTVPLLPMPVEPTKLR